MHNTICITCLVCVAAELKAHPEKDVELDNLQGVVTEYKEEIRDLQRKYFISIWEGS